MDVTCGVIALETSERSLMVHWKSIALDYNFFILKDPVKSEPFNFKNKRLRLQLNWSSSNRSFGKGSFILRIVHASYLGKSAAFRDCDGALMFETKMQIRNDVYYPKEKGKFVVFRNTHYRIPEDVQIFVECFRHKRGSKSECSHLTEDRYLELSKNLKELYLNKLHCDFTITVRQQSFQVHKIILTTRSTVFAAMMKNDMAEKKNNSADITDCDPGAFHVFLLYLYSGEIGELSTENVIDVYIIADKYGVGNLKKDCVEYMKKSLSFDTFCDIIELAATYNELELLKSSKEFFVENSREIVSAANFQLLMKKNTALASELILLLTPGN